MKQLVRNCHLGNFHRQAFEYFMRICRITMFGWRIRKTISVQRQTLWDMQQNVKIDCMIVHEVNIIIKTASLIIQF